MLVSTPLVKRDEVFAPWRHERRGWPEWLTSVGGDEFWLWRARRRVASPLSPVMQLEDESFVGRDRGKSAVDDEGEIEISKELWIIIGSIFASTFKYPCPTDNCLFLRVSIQLHSRWTFFILSLSLFKCIFKNHHLSVLFFFKARSQLCKVKFLSSLSTHTLLYLNFARTDERGDTRICFFFIYRRGKEISALESKYQRYKHIFILFPSRKRI